MTNEEEFEKWVRDNRELLPFQNCVGKVVYAAYLAGIAAGEQREREAGAEVAEQSETCCETASCATETIAAAIRARSAK